MDRQAIFNQVQDHLRYQGVKCFDHYTSNEFHKTQQCRYRSLDGTQACAFGVLIPKELYRPAFEGYKCSSILDMEPKLREILGVIESEDIAFLLELQSAHDYFMPSILEGSLYRWEQKMLSIADNYGLWFNPPSESREGKQKVQEAIKKAAEVEAEILVEAQS